MRARVEECGVAAHRHRSKAAPALVDRVVLQQSKQATRTPGPAAPRRRPRGGARGAPIACAAVVRTTACSENAGRSSGQPATSCNVVDACQRMARATRKTPAQSLARSRPGRCRRAGQTSKRGQQLHISAWCDGDGRQQHQRDERVAARRDHLHTRDSRQHQQSPPVVAPPRCSSGSFRRRRACRHQRQQRSRRHWRKEAKRTRRAHQDGITPRTRALLDAPKRRQSELSRAAGGAEFGRTRSTATTPRSGRLVGVVASKLLARRAPPAPAEAATRPRAADAIPTRYGTWTKSAAVTLAEA